MDNIVMAPIAGLPMADGMAAAAGAAKADAGQFGAMVDAQLALLTGEGKGGKKSQAADAGSLAALLLASLIQGFTRTDGQDDEEVPDEAAAAAVQNQTQQTPAAPADTAGQELIEIFTANNPGYGALTRLFAGDKDALAALTALMGDSHGNEELKELINTVSGNGEETYPATPEALAAGGSEAAEVSQPNQTGLKALMEIRRLFSGIVANMDTTGAQEQAAPGAETVLTRERMGDMIARIDALTANAELTETETGTPAVTMTLAATAWDKPEGSALDTAADTDAQELESPETAGAGRGKEPIDFTTALRAYRGEVNAKAAPAENSAAVALRQGEQAFDAIVDKITSMQSAGQKEMEIRLKPDFLGNVVIKLTMGDDGLTASIAASNPKVQDAFMSQASALQTSLAEQGLKDVRVVVTSSSVQDAALQQQQLSQGHGQARQDKPKRSLAAITALGGTPAASQPLLVYEQAYRTGLVNRLA